MAFSSYGKGRYAPSEAHVLIAPGNYIPNGKIPGVLWAHGAGGNAISAKDPSFKYRYDPFGLYFPTLACDFGTNPSNMGNDDAIASVSPAKAYLQSSTSECFAKVGSVFLVGSSMGALTCLNWARQNVSSVKAIALFIPALDLDDIYQNDKAGLRNDIETAYGITYPTPIPNLNTHSPVAYPADVAGIPIRIWASDDDPWGSATAVCQAWSTAVGGSTVTVFSVGSVQHTVVTWAPGVAAEWFRGYL